MEADLDIRECTCGKCKYCKKLKGISLQIAREMMNQRWQNSRKNTLDALVLIRSAGATFDEVLSLAKKLTTNL